MAENNHEPPGFLALLRKVGVTALGALQNRGELLVIELQEEKARLLELFVWALGLLCLAMMGLLLLTATIIYLFAEEYRLYVAAAFTILYFAGAAVAFFTLRSLLRRPTLPETLTQVRKDRLWLESLD